MSAFLSARSTLADRVAATRHQRFVGRHAEIAWFRAALALPEPPFAVLFLHGPGGIGKTTLLSEYRRLAHQDSRPVVAIDGRACEPSPPGVLAAIGRELGIPDPAACLPALAALDNLVLFIDTYEALRPLDGWLRNDVLPRLPASAVTVIAGRAPPDLAWRASAGWGDLVAVQPLRNLAPAESRDYLSRRGIPSTAHASVIEFTHGHPLALSLIGDVAVRTRAAFTPEDAPDVVAALIDHFIEHEPSPLHRQALETCATARVTTEALLARAFGDDQAHQLFSWLCGLSFIEHDRDGVFPHDLARDALVANLRWRHPTRFVETHTMVHDYVVEQVRSTRGREQFQWLYSLMFLHRNNPTWRTFAPMDQHGQEYLDAPTPDDAVQFIDIVQRHEGPRSAEIADRWLRIQPDQLRVLRDVHGEMNGAILGIELGRLRRDDVAFDPIAVSIFDMVERHGPLRTGDEAICARFAMGRDQYRTPTLRLSFSILGSSMIYTRPRLAWMCTPVVDPPFWEKMFQYVHLNPYPDADVSLDGRTWHMYAHDWRQEPIEVLDPILTEHEMSVSPVPDDVADTAPALMVLSETEFRQAVRQALRDFHRAGVLAANPLGHSRLVQTRAGMDRVAALRELLVDAAATLMTGSRLRRLHDALRLTWLEPAGTQEAVAEELGVPFSTYRRHLAAAADHVADELWRQELALGGFRSA